MTSRQGDAPFQLDPLPAELWGMPRMVREFRADDRTIRQWVREGELPGPCMRRGGRAFWNPSAVVFYRDQRLRRIGVEGETAGLDHTDGPRKPASGQTTGENA